MARKYSIGDMSRICQISTKALRYYDKIGLITSCRQDYNNYRYYTDESLLAVPVIKYYKQMGFTLEEMKAFIEGSAPNVYNSIQKSFLGKIKELEIEQSEIQRKHISVQDWYDIILEAEMVIENNIHEVSIKYMEPKVLIYQSQIFDNKLKESIINIEFTNFLEKIGNAISGPVILNFSSYEDRVKENRQKIRIMQKALSPIADDVRFLFGGGVMATCYHIGSHESIHETYKKICTWVDKHGYIPEKESFERYVADYWLTSNSAQFVTEIMLKVSRQGGVRG